jgi:hypothetical protein
MRFGILRVAAFAFLISPLFATAQAQSTSVMAPGDIAVTGFSGVPGGKTDQPFDLDGPSLRVIGLPGGEFGLRDSANRYTVTANDIGQVFGVAIDNQQQPNIYAAATSAYGLAIFTEDGRVQRGARDANYAPGQFGPADHGGGPNSIWRIDGHTGQVSLFANVNTGGVAPQPAALGGLAFDPRTHQLFVADRATGLIHRFTMDGHDRGTYDHGVDGHSAAGLPPIAFDPSGLADIKRRDFRTHDPDTWGTAVPERRIFALAMHNGRLFYSVADGSVWSVGIANNGSFGRDARLETKIRPLHRGAEISSITFDGRGWMYTVERGATTGDSDFMAIADDGRSRVKRFAPKPPNDPASGFWVQPGDEYGIGMAPDYRNADGGAVIACNRNLWSTGERLLDDPSAPSNSYPHVDGLQGNDIGQVKPASAPPSKSWFFSYYDDQANPASRGHMGAIAIWNVCGGGGYTIPPPAIRVSYSCPPGTFWIGGECLVAPLCPSGTIFRGGYCLYPNCPFGFIGSGNRCVKPPLMCRFGEVYQRDRCVPIGCSQNLRFDRRGYCGCPEGLSYRDGRCSQRPPCDAWLFRASNGTCKRCPDGSLPRDGKCVQRPPCDRDGIAAIGNCKPCNPNDLRSNEYCKRPCDPNDRRTSESCKKPCDPNDRRDNANCSKPPCNPDDRRASENCKNPCNPNDLRSNENCKKTPCNPNGIAATGNCNKPSKCKDERDGQCAPVHKQPICKMVDGKCETTTRKTGSDGKVLKGDDTPVHRVHKPSRSGGSTSHIKRTTDENTPAQGASDRGNNDKNGGENGSGHHTRPAGSNDSSRDEGSNAKTGQHSRYNPESGATRYQHDNSAASGNREGGGGGEAGNGHHGRSFNSDNSRSGGMSDTMMGSRDGNGRHATGEGGGAERQGACPRGEARRGQKCVPQ